MARSTPTARSVPANAETQTGCAASASAGSGFSTLLTAIGAVPTGAPVPAPGTEPVAVAVAAAAPPSAGETAAAATLSGTSLPIGTTGGKELPVSLPGLPQGLPACDESAKPKEAKSTTAHVPVALPPLALVAATVDERPAEDSADGPDETSPESRTDGAATQGAAPQPLASSKAEVLLAVTDSIPPAAHTSAPAAPVQGNAAPAAKAGNPAQTQHDVAPQPAPRPSEAAPAPANAVAVHVAPEAQVPQAVAAPRPGARDRRPDRAAGVEGKVAVHSGDAAHGPAPRPMTNDSAIQQPATPALIAQQHTDLAAPAAQPSIAHRAPQADAVRDLTQIVDRLAAAREAFAPAAAALAVDHADFGELSLRFNHHRDGRIDVQIAAADPASHRAIAAAVAQHGASQTGENSAQSGQNAQSSAQGQARSRDASGERDGHAGQGASAREGQSDTRRQAPREQRQAPGGRPHGGVFA